jgi:hypothetical protein
VGAKREQSSGFDADDALGQGDVEIDLSWHVLL